MDRIDVVSNAKINLTLDVLKKRDDGYHELKMIMQTVSLCDCINIKKTDTKVSVFFYSMESPCSTTRCRG